VPSRSLSAGLRASAQPNCPPLAAGTGRLVRAAAVLTLERLDVQPPAQLLSAPQLRRRVARLARRSGRALPDLAALDRPALRALVAELRAAAAPAFEPAGKLVA